MAKSKKDDKKFVKLFWKIAAGLVLIPILLILTVAIFGNLPDFKKLENPDTPLATKILSSDGVVLGKFYNANRTLVNFEELSPNLVNALVSTEDVRFYSHSGVDFSRLFTIPFYNLIGRKQGASTLSQQLARNLFPRQKMNKIQLIWRKIEEQITAVKLERLYTKEEIMAMYLNTVEFNNNAVGINSASHIYFDKSPDKLSITEAAMIVGMLKNPTLFDPVRRPVIALRRRNTVLDQMRKNDKLTAADFNKLKLKDLGIDYHPETHNDGIAAYYREYIRQWIKPWAAEHHVDIYTDGLTIYSTIDSRLQKYAEESVSEQLKPMQKELYAQYRNTNTKPWSESPEILNTCMRQSDRYRSMKKEDATDDKIMKAFYRPVRMKLFSYHGEVDTTISPLDSIKYNLYFLHSGFMAMDPSTGQVKVWVGGINYKYFKYDHVTSTRQVGSTFKPFVYSTAIMNGYSPCLKVWNVPVVFENYNNWTPQNADKMFDGQQMTLAKGLATSTNRITAWVMKQVGPEPVVKLAQRMGITDKLDAVPSLCLGTTDLSVMEMVGAYNTFNNKGVHIDPLLVTRIEDKNGNVLQEFIPKTVEALDESKNYVMINMLKGVCNGGLYGTATRLRNRYKLQGPMAGKTGTTQNNSDAWFMGLIPQLTGGVWVGGEERAIHFNNMHFGQGAALALPIWGYFLQKVYADKSLGFDPNRDWEKPAGDLGIEIDCAKYETTRPPDEGSSEEDIWKARD
jgi:penicillin-binding protein 1A